MAARKHERFEILRKASWDFFTAGSGLKNGYIANISRGGCLLKTNELIEHRRWLRMVIPDDSHDVWATVIGRVIRCEHQFEVIEPGDDLTTYRYGIEFVALPTEARAVADGRPAGDYLPLILALSSRNATVRSCLSLNTKSS